jgi:hypothetical protein
MKAADRESPNSRARLCNEPSRWGGRPEPSSLIYRGWKVRKFPPEGEVFFLTFTFIELVRIFSSRARRGGVALKSASKKNFGISNSGR